MPRPAIMPRMHRGQARRWASLPIPAMLDMQACSRARCRTFGPARDLDERRPFGSARQATQKQGRWRRYRSALPCIVCHRSSPHGRDGETVVRREGEKGRAVTVGHYACPRCLGCRFLPTRRLTFLPDPTSCRTGVIWPRARPRRDSTWAVWMCRRSEAARRATAGGRGCSTSEVCRRCTTCSTRSPWRQRTACCSRRVWPATPVISSGGEGDSNAASHQFAAYAHTIAGLVAGQRSSWSRTRSCCSRVGGRMS